MLTLKILAALSALELLIWLPPIWSLRKLYARLILIMLAGSSVWLLSVELRVWTVVVVMLSLYLCLNLARIAANRIQPTYLYHSSRRTAFWLIGAQILVVGVAEIVQKYAIDPLALWYILAMLQLLAAGVLLQTTLHHLKHTRKPMLNGPGVALPSLSVLIPARNETTDLEACLQSLSASTYPKLEIIVLDDCSQDKRTPEIIRGFAHAGVQFLAGSPPPEAWLAKNHAYDQLTAAANGELLLFCGVDTRFEPDSLTVLVRTLLQKNKHMISVIPRNVLPHNRGLTSWFLQANRYAWELTLPRQLLKRPPVLSTCWLITKETLEKAGGFAAVRRKGVPESYFARFTASESDGYSFLQSDDDIGVTSEKGPAEQRATAIRTRYLQLHRRPELAALISLLEFSVLVWPFVMAVAGALRGQWLLVAVTIVSALINSIVYAKLVNLTYRRFIAKGLWLLPMAALYDIGLLNYSMWLYEFSEVIWKGRNVCIPIMRAIASLPKA